MINATLPQLIQYFIDFQKDKYPNSAFIYGVARKVNERVQNLEPEHYPILHLERPYIVSDNNGANDFKEFFVCVINAFDKYTTSGTVDENDMSEILAESRTLVMLQQLQQKLNHDCNDGLLEFEIVGNEKSPIRDGYVQYNTGWQLIVKIGLNASNILC